MVSADVEEQSFRSLGKKKKDQKKSEGDFEGEDGKKKKKKKKSKKNKQIGKKRNPCNVDSSVSEIDCAKRNDLASCNVVWVEGPGSIAKCKATKKRPCEGKTRFLDDNGCQQQASCDYKSETQCENADEAGANCEVKYKKGEFKKCVVSKKKKN